MTVLIRNLQDAQQIIASLHAAPIDFLDPTRPASVKYALESNGEIRRDNTQKHFTDTSFIDAPTAARKLFSERRFYNAQQRHTARQE